MICMQTRLKVADNTGAKEVMCIKVLGGSHRRFAYTGDVIVVSVKVASPNSKAAKGSIQKAVIVRTRKGIRRKNGSSIKFDDNAVVLLKPTKEPIGTRIFGPIPREIGAQYSKIVSLAPEVY